MASIDAMKCSAALEGRASKAFQSLEGLRGWLAWWVVLGHALHLGGQPAWMPKFLAATLDRGDCAVNIFIILSGFVICNLILVKQEAYFQYIARRFVRLAPVYFLSLCLAALTTGAYRFAYLELPFASSPEMRTERMAETNAHAGLHWLAHVTMLHGLVPKSLLPYAGTSILAPAWSLSLEWQFYLIAPALIGCLSRRPASLLLGVVSIVGLAYVSRRLVGDQYQYGSMLLLSLHFFAIGIFSRLLLDSKFGRSRTMWVAAALGAIGMLLKYPTEACVWLLWSLFAHLEVAQGSPSIGLALVSQRFLATNTVVIALGKWSYPTYLLHIPVFAAFVWAGVNGLEAQASGPALQRGVWICLVMSMMALVPLSWATHVYLEKPAMRWFMRYSSGDGQR